MLKKVIMASFTVLSWHLPGWTEEHHDGPQSSLLAEI
jgi:hypothetical protein